MLLNPFSGVAKFLSLEKKLNVISRESFIAMGVNIKKAKTN